MTNVRISGFGTPRGLKAWFAVASIFSLFLVVSTFFLRLGVALPDAAVELNLANENNVAAWWSGILLAMIGLHALDGHTLLRTESPDAARAWLLISGVLLFLSADEIGSFHERLAWLGETLELGTWSLLLPLGGVLGVILAWALGLLWRAGDSHRRRVGPLVLGILLLGSVALQEVAEHSFDWGTPFVSALRTAVEEGTELCGMLVLLRVALSQTAQLTAVSPGIPPIFSVLFERRRSVVVLSCILLPVLAALTIWLPDLARRGHPADWLAAVVFLAAGLATSRRLLAGGGGLVWALAALCVLASAASVAVDPAATHEIGAFDVGRRSLLLVGVCVLVWATWSVLSKSRDRVRELVLLAVLSAVLVVIPAAVVIGYVLPTLLALVLFWKNTDVVAIDPPVLAHAEAGGPAALRSQ